MSSTAGDTQDRTVRARDDLPKAKTSAAAAFALIFGLLAFFGILSILFSPIALPLAVLGLFLGIVASSGPAIPSSPERSSRSSAWYSACLRCCSLSRP